MISFGTLGTARITPAALIYPCMNEPRAYIRSIAARDRTRAEAYAAAHHIGHVYDTYSDVINDPKVNAIYNPLHIPAHHPHTISALNAGKHVLCEKSLACNAAEAIEMRDLAAAKGLVLMDAFHYRYHPLFERCRQLIQAGELGEIEHIDATFQVPVTDPDDIRMNYELGGGVTMDIGCYPISWVRHLTDQEPQVLTATAEIGPPEVDVFLQANMALEDGITARVTGDMRAEAAFKAEITVRGSRGSIVVNNPIAPQMGHLVSITVDGKERQEVFDRRPTYAYQLDAFLAAVESGASIATDGDDAVRQMKVIDQCYEAAGLRLRGCSD